MKILALFIGAVMICIGVIGLAAPGRFVMGAEYSLTPRGLYIIAGLRIVVGIVLLIAASASRMATTMRVFGAIAVVAGLTTPLVGLDRARAIFAWSSTYGTSVIRVWGVIALLAGAVIAFAFAGSRRAV